MSDGGIIIGDVGFDDEAVGMVRPELMCCSYRVFQATIAFEVGGIIEMERLIEQWRDDLSDRFLHNRIQRMPRTNDRAIR